MHLFQNPFAGYDNFGRRASPLLIFEVFCWGRASSFLMYSIFNLDLAQYGSYNPYYGNSGASGGTGSSCKFANMPMQYGANFHGCKMVISYMKN